VKIGININTCKDAQGNILKAIKEAIFNIDKNISIAVFKDSNLEEYNIKELDFVITLGGDGTILHTARLFSPWDIPILGINIGNLGFLSALDLPGFYDNLEKIINKEYYIDERMMLKCSLGEEEQYINSLNEIVIAKGALSKISRYEIYIDDKLYNTFRADGVIIATPTGSTAYSLSAGGPIVEGGIEAIIITAICPHYLGSRSIVVSSSKTVEIKVFKKQEKVYLTVDGQESFEIYEESIKISKSDIKCKLVRLNDYDYYNILRKKILP